MTSSSQKDLFSSVISEIKSYTGDDPLRPWVRGIRKIYQSLPPHVLSEKLPRFLQKCAQTFESDRRYRNDSRYVAVWIQLMDYVEDARVLLRKMEKSQIGVKRTKFYTAYALYYEKKKRFEDSEKMYQLGVQRLAEPVGELQKSYDQFLHRMKLLKHRRARLEEAANIGETSTSGHSQKTSTSIDLKNYQKQAEHENSIIQSFFPGNLSTKQNGLVSSSAESFYQTESAEENSGCTGCKSLARSQSIPINDLDKSAPFHSDDVGLSQVGDARLHGLSDPVINTKEAMNVINGMFKEPLQLETISRNSNQVNQKPNQRGNTIEVFVDEEREESGDVNQNIIYKTRSVSVKPVNSDSQKRNGNTELQTPFVGSFKILADDEDDEDSDDNAHEYCSEMEEPMEITCQHAWPTSQTSTETRLNSFDIRLKEDTVFRRLKEDTVIRKIVGSKVFDEPKVENACHHGLVDPTVNLKQAIDDINGMFGKPLNFFKAGKPKKQEKMFSRKSDSSKDAFFILADDDIEKDLNGQAPPCISHSSNVEVNLFEPTLFTKEAMNEINDLFGRSLDF
ncbi:probable inactive serine/threonine-protein kinase bub1 [Dendrobium catenatum]|uniref:Checkpoint serine/threonine-protein kinase n=1 Tax=Dendrobium catenatum TaxID=906689 RepID=A0A2I0VP95_9ASPA|nr:probable inactive serine/threonine-protein kinase bub1 [Dendrobium catenatum]PKU65228.1 checkpoint serine/threonine-protein kinase [Dendrobium catenatum]